MIGWLCPYIEEKLFSALEQTLEFSHRADFCVGYFNLRGRSRLDEYVERWAGRVGNNCRLLIDMQRLPVDELRTALGHRPRRPARQPERTSAQERSSGTSNTNLRLRAYKVTAQTQEVFKGSLSRPTQ